MKLKKCRVKLMIRKIKFISTFVVSIFISTSLFAGPGVESYSDLLHALRDVRKAAAARIETATNNAKVEEAWQMGNLIQQNLLLNKGRADYGASVLDQLANDLEMSHAEIYRCALFAKSYSQLPSGLPWSHYRVLITVKDAEERTKIETEDTAKHWSVQLLIQQVHLRKLSVEHVDETPLEPQRGKLNTYQVINEDDHLKIDLGFSSFKELPPGEEKKYRQGDIVQAEKWKIELAPDRTTLDLYTYSATVFEVTDGDTFWALVDLGFGFTTKQKLRLRGIDAPELPTEEGLEAKAFVQERLKNGQKIIICSTRSDKYDRYLADVYYTAKDGDHFLNNELLENRLALRA